MLGTNAATWRNRGGRAPMLFDTPACTMAVTRVAIAKKEVRIESMTVTRRGSLNGSDRSSSYSEFACSTEMMSDVPNIGTAMLPFKEMSEKVEEDDTPASSLAVVPYFGKSKKVAWATPKSLHDTRVITPISHPNRSGQFCGKETHGKITNCLFEGNVGTEAEVALMDGSDFICWLPCTIIARRGDIYDINIHDEQEARNNSVAGDVAKGIHCSYLQYYSYDDIMDVSTLDGFEQEDGVPGDDSDLESECNYNNGYDGDEDSREEFDDDSFDSDDDSESGLS
eukprot:TRINITY_DN4046_c0_g1_i1.p1 TRINITY_DN4046_c0_g1~~TRINITY_DN4046_c0_g1_i1.p1  ORF type:complete len:300 (+),score=54.67 TRINITY_DN4046_c0_g1_i1:55-900(+)